MGLFLQEGVFLYTLGHPEFPHSHLGSPLADNSGYLLNVTSFNAVLEKGSNWLAVAGFALEQLVENSQELGLVLTEARH